MSDVLSRAALPRIVHAPPTAEELALVLGEFNATAHPVPPTTAIGPFEAQAVRTPDAPALVTRRGSVTYAELNARANRVARRLMSYGAGPDRAVGLALPTAADTLIGVLAALKAGAAWVPAPTPAAVTVLRELGPENGYLSIDPPRPLTPQHAAALCPRTGAVVPHAALDHRMRWLQSVAPVGPGGRVLFLTAGLGDVAEALRALRAGAAVVPGDSREPERLARTVRELGVTSCQVDPSVLRRLLPCVGSEAEPDPERYPGPDADRAEQPAVLSGAPHTPLALRQVICTADVLSRHDARRFARALPGVRLHRLFGHAHGSGAIAHHACGPDDFGPVPLGRPAWNTRVYVLDAALRPCPPGVPGDLYATGPHLITAGRGVPASWFVDDPYGPAGSRLHRTGARALWSDGGELIGVREGEGPFRR
ncbi:AMP-binding protein [Streptomyces sp. NPDC050418]|uniref:AMP-binding protein n=1 Tax=Streptomyces sp. NPDC050418 TaxID=3365612 RepID=UPI0037B7FDE1